MAIRTATFKEIVRRKCYDELERVGFTRFAKEGVDWPLHDGFHSWVGLNTGLYSDRVEINPFVGLHVIPIAKLRALEGRRYDRRIATYAVHMGELPAARDEKAFVFTTAQGDTFLLSEIQRLARIYATAGLDYSKSIASYGALLPLLEGRLHMLGGYPENVACCLYLMGRTREAYEFAEDFLMQEPDYFHDFAIPFFEMIESERGKSGKPVERPE
jgi:hypothetical protein